MFLKRKEHGQLCGDCRNGRGHRGVNDGKNKVKEKLKEKENIHWPTTYKKEKIKNKI